MLEQKYADQLIDYQILLTDSQDIEWAKETYIPDDLGEKCPISKDEVASVLISGNEDEPNEVWVSNYFCPLVSTKYWRVI